MTSISPEFNREFLKLDKVYRAGWLLKGIPKEHCETVLEHSIAVGNLGFYLAKKHRPDLNAEHVRQLGIYHDMAEIYTGDITPLDEIGGDEKLQLEHTELVKGMSKIPGSKKYVELWEESEFRQSEEGKFVKDIDKYQMALQAFEYEIKYGVTLDEFYESSMERIKSKEIMSELKNLMQVREAHLHQRD